MKKMTITIKIKRITRRRGKILVRTEKPKRHGTEKACPIAEFVIVATFGGLVLCHLASMLTNVIRKGGREGKKEGRQAD